MLTNLEVAEEYRSDRDNLIHDFYLPCLEKSMVYSRAVGYFSSTVMIAVAKGLTGLIHLKQRKIDMILFTFFCNNFN